MISQQREAILQYWFGDQEPPADAVRKRWFSGGDEVDADIKARFSAVHTQIREGLAEQVLANPESRLAGIIVIDQFSRNLYRGSAQAFAWDSLAQQWALFGWDNHLFDSLSPCQQAFSAMPLMHSEDLTLHRRSLAIFQEINSRLPDTDTIITGFYSSAMQHHDIIAQFGRYPHRNSVLGRESTTAERAYLTDGAKRFGQ